METMTQNWLEAFDAEGETPLTRALKSGNYSLTSVMCEYEAKLKSAAGNAPVLHKAAQDGRDNLVEALLDKGADPDGMDEDHDTAMHKAVREGHLTTVMTLLHSGASPNLRDGLGLAPLHWAVLKGNSELVQLLIQFGAEVNIRDSFGAMTPITYARLLGYKQLARLLARFGGTW